MEILYRDEAIVVCIKPPRVLSTDEPGGLPELLRQELGGEIRTVHRLDRVVGGLMVLARSADAASELSRQIREGQFDKRYLAVVRGELPESGCMRDLLRRDKAERKTYVAEAPGKGVQEAELRYRTLARRGGSSLVSIELLTGRTHQIRCQFSARGWPLLGDRKYSLDADDCEIALWSHRLRFLSPLNGQNMSFIALPPEGWPWSDFREILRT